MDSRCLPVDVLVVGDHTGSAKGDPRAGVVVISGKLTKLRRGQLRSPAQLQLQLPPFLAPSPSTSIQDDWRHHDITAVGVTAIRFIYSDSRFPMVGEGGNVMRKEKQPLLSLRASCCNDDDDSSGPSFLEQTVTKCTSL